jgi:hypothetical protein
MDTKAHNCSFMIRKNKKELRFVNWHEGEREVRSEEIYGHSKFVHLLQSAPADLSLSLHHFSSI